MRKLSTSPTLLNVEQELQKLYARRLAVDNLIHSLEEYNRSLQSPSPPKPPAERAASSGASRMVS